MNNLHPTAEQIDRYRSRSASPSELISVDEHITECDHCLAAVNAGQTGEMIVTLPAMVKEPEHLAYDEMEGWIDDRLGEVERELVEGHVEDCSRCREELQDLALVREQGAAASVPTPVASHRWALAAAAVLSVTVAAAWIVFRDRSMPEVEQTQAPVASATSSPVDLPADLRAHLDEVLRSGALSKPQILEALTPGSAALRGAASVQEIFSLQEPIGTVVREPRPQFRWTPVRGASSYRVTVVEAATGEVTISGSTRDSSWRPAEPLQPGRTYSWQVKAQRGAETITVPRPPAPEALFAVAATDQIEQLTAWQSVLPDDHLRLGILLAERGLLDEAESELELSARAGEPRANELLTQVRSWRL